MFDRKVVFLKHIYSLFAILLLFMFWNSKGYSQVKFDPSIISTIIPDSLEKISPPALPNIGSIEVPTPDSTIILIPDSIAGWELGSSASLNFSQSSFSNYTAGGQDAIIVNSLITGYALYKKRALVVENTLFLNYGFSSFFSTGQLVKNDDRINLTTKIGYNINKKIKYSGFIDFKTQFTEGFLTPSDTSISSDFFAPAYLFSAFGLDFHLLKDVSIIFSPISFKGTLVLNSTLANLGAFGVKPAQYNADGRLIRAGERFRGEVGGFIRIAYNKRITKTNKQDKLSIFSEIELFSNYLINPQNIDVQWDNIITYKINKIFSAFLSTTAIYDDDVTVFGDTDNDGIEESLGPKIQFKQVFGLGIYVTF